MTLAVTPATLVAGGIATVCIQGGPPNTTITVGIDDGEDKTDSLPIETDANGNGCSDWSVPTDWDIAKFNYGDCPEVVRHII